MPDYYREAFFFSIPSEKWEDIIERCSDFLGFFLNVFPFRVYAIVKASYNY